MLKREVELFIFTKWLTRRHTGVLDNRLVRRHTGVQVYSGIYLERRRTSLLSSTPVCRRASHFVIFNIIIFKQC